MYFYNVNNCIAPSVEIKNTTARNIVIAVHCFMLHDALSFIYCLLLQNHNNNFVFLRINEFLMFYYIFITSYKFLYIF